MAMAWMILAFFALGAQAEAAAAMQEAATVAVPGPTTTEGASR
jgi:hypothetical protein